MTIKNFRFAIYAALLALAPSFGSLQGAQRLWSGIKKTAKGAKQGFRMNILGLKPDADVETALRYWSGKEDRNNFDLMIPVPVRTKNDNTGQYQTTDEFIRAYHTEGISQSIARDNREKFTLDNPIYKGFIWVVLKFTGDKNAKSGKIARKEDIILVDGYGNKLPDQNLDLILFGFDPDDNDIARPYIKNVRCYVPDASELEFLNEDQLKIYPWNPRHIRFPSGEAAVGKNEESYQSYINNMIIYRDGTPIFLSEDVQRFKEGKSYEIYENIGVAKEEAQKLPDPITLGSNLGTGMLSRYTWDTLPKELKYSFPEMEASLFGRGQVPGYHVHDYIYRKYKSQTTAIARQLRKGTPQALEAQQKADSIRKMFKEARSIRFLSTILIYYLIGRALVLIIDILGGSALKALKRKLFPDVELGGVNAAYSLEVNPVINAADSLGVGKLARTILRSLGLWRPRPASDIKRVFFATKNAETKAKEYDEDIEEGYLSNKEAVAEGRVPNSNIRSLLVHGPPGTGKSLFIKSKMEEYRRKGYSVYRVYTVKDIIRYSPAQVAQLAVKIKKEANAAKKAGKIFFLVLHEIDALGTRDPESKAYNPAMATLLFELIQTFDEVGLPWFAVVGSTNYHPDNVKKLDPAFKDRFDDFEMELPSPSTLIDICLEELKLQAERANMTISNIEAIEKYLQTAPYIQKTTGLTGRHMSTEVQKIILLRSRKIRQANRKRASKGKKPKKKRVISVGDVHEILTRSYKHYASKYEVEEDGEQQEN